jgi:hypothetical protein
MKKEGREKKRQLVLLLYESVKLWVTRSCAEFEPSVTGCQLEQEAQKIMVASGQVKLLGNKESKTKLVLW